MTMLQQMTEQFMEALQQAEKTRDVEPLISLFADQGIVSNPGLEQPACGHQELRRFWRDHLAEFWRIRSEFTHVVEQDDTSVLEWTAEAICSTGKIMVYQGASVLEVADGKIQQLRNYYNSPRLLAPPTDDLRQWIQRRHQPGLD